MSTSTPGATRTPDTRFRKPLLYPPELQGHHLVEATKLRCLALATQSSAFRAELYP